MRVRILTQELVNQIHEVVDIVELSVPQNLDLELAHIRVTSHEVFQLSLQSLLQGKEIDRIVIERMEE